MKSAPLSRSHPPEVKMPPIGPASGAGPLHTRIESELRRMLAGPEFPPGALFPDEMTLANRFGVSRGTMRVAIARLVDARLLQRRAGVGTRVLPPSAESSIGEWRSFSGEMARRNITVESYHLRTTRCVASARVARALQIGEGTELLRLDRVRGWNNTPVLHSRSWFHPRLRLTAAADFSRPLYDLIETETGATAHSAAEEFSAVSAPAPLARALRVKVGAPLLLRCHTVFDAGQRPMEFAAVHYVSGRFTLTMELKHQGL